MAPGLFIVTVRVELRGLRHPPKRRFLQWAQYLFLVVGCLTLCFCAFVYLEARVYQASETRRFNGVLQSRVTPPGVPTLGRHGIPTQNGSPISRIDIPRIGISAMVLEGVAPRSLRLAVGHVRGTALPGESGNVAIAGHRDTFFRKLRDIRANDTITLTTLRGSFEYSVESTEVVDPNNLQALHASSEPILTLITCYPFYFVGPAPKRFIVRARQVSSTESYPPSIGR